MTGAAKVGVIILALEVRVKRKMKNKGKMVRDNKHFTVSMLVSSTAVQLVDSLIPLADWSTGVHDGYCQMYQGYQFSSHSYYDTYLLSISDSILTQGFFHLDFKMVMLLMLLLVLLLLFYSSACSNSSSEENRAY